MQAGFVWWRENEYEDFASYKWDESMNNNRLFPVLIERTVLVWSFTNRFLRIVPIAVLGYLLFILIFNASHGFDITDESFYILWASQPEHVLASTTQFGYYTRLLYIISNESIATFRILGLLLLLSVGGFFFVALERYWMSLSGAVLHARLRWETICLILIGTLVYYRSWLLTPSYNWLALFCTLVVATGLLRVATNGVKDMRPNKMMFGLLINGLLVGIGGGIAFMAKPTTALILSLVTLYWVVVHYQRFWWKSFLGIALTSACSVLFMHAIIFKGGIIPFYVQLREGMEIGKILGAGHSIGNIFYQGLIDMKHIPFRVFTLISAGFLIAPFVLWMVRRNIGRNRETVAQFILSLFLILFPLVTCYRLWETGQWSRTGMGFSGFALLLALIFSALLSLLAWNKKSSESEKIPFMHLAALSFFLFMLAVAYAFGSGNGLVRQMSGAYVFFAAGILYSAFWIDQYLDRKILWRIVPALVAISALLVMNTAFNHPYRLPEKISKQVVKTSFLASNGFLYVDKPTAGYINDLKRIALESGWKPGTSFIDLTGGSPGATVILGGRIMGVPWLLGAYKGSSKFAKTAIEMAPKSEQHTAWVLISPKGKIRIPSEFLLDLGIDFPECYEMVGKTKTGYRNEEQTLWRPLNCSSLKKTTVVVK